MENEFEYPCSLLVNSITRIDYPELDDEFAKDLEFDSMEQMRAKIAEDLKPHNDELNVNIENNAVIGKLYQDNKFALPMKTISYLAEKEAERERQEYRKFYEYQYKMQISQEMIGMFILLNLRRVMPIEVTDEMMEEYLRHEAIMDDKSLEAYKEANKDEIGTEPYKDAVQNYFIMRKISQASSFFIPEPEQAPEEIPEAETVEAAETQTEE